MSEVVFVKCDMCGRSVEKDKAGGWVVVTSLVDVGSESIVEHYDFDCFIRMKQLHAATLREARRDMRLEAHQ